MHLLGTAPNFGAIQPGCRRLDLFVFELQRCYDANCTIVAPYDQDDSIPRGMGRIGYHHLSTLVQAAVAVFRNEMRCIVQWQRRVQIGVTLSAEIMWRRIVSGMLHCWPWCWLMGIICLLRCIYCWLRYIRCWSIRWRLVHLMGVWSGSGQSHSFILRYQTVEHNFHSSFHGTFSCHMP